MQTITALVTKSGNHNARVDSMWVLRAVEGRTAVLAFDGATCFVPVDCVHLFFASQWALEAFAREFGAQWTIRVEGRSNGQFRASIA